MSETPDETHELWNSVLTQLNGDDRVTPQLQGFLDTLGYVYHPETENPVYQQFMR